MKDKLIVITAEEFFVGEAKLINQLFESGLRKLHLRKPEGSREKIAKLLSQILPNFRKYISIHNHHNLATEFNLGGQHYSHTDILNMDLRNAEYEISCSLHRWEDLDALKSNIDYCFISPVYNSISKPGYRANETLRTVPDSAKGFPVYALGGINLLNCKHLLQKGFHGVAVLGYVWEDKEQTLKRFKNLNEEIESYAQ